MHNNTELVSDGIDSRKMTAKAMQKDFEYEMAQKITEQLYNAGLISFDEMNSIRRMNKEKFSPFFGDIMS